MPDNVHAVGTTQLLHNRLLR